MLHSYSTVIHCWRAVVVGHHWHCCAAGAGLGWYCCTSHGGIVIIALVLVVLVDIVILVLKALWRGCYTGKGFNISKPTLPWTVLASYPRAPATLSKVPNWLALSRLSQTVPVVLSTAFIPPLLPVLETF